MTVIHASRVIGAALVAVAVGTLTAAAQRTNSRITVDRPLIIQSTYGADLFRFYCSKCHGLDAKGRAGRAAVRVPPPDLTGLSRRNNGQFPRDRVFNRIKYGDVVPSAHGTSDMPVWGAIFRGLESSEAMVDVRLENLVQYLESLQNP